MPAAGLALQRVSAPRLRSEAAAFAALLVDAVDSGAGMGFLPPLSAADAEAYWRGAARDVAAGRRVVLAARVDGALAGSAQLALATQPNGLHRAEVQKVMVDRAFRRRGVGLALMRAVEDAARARGRSTLVLDTFADQDARRLYEAAGWTHVGDVPAYARLPDGSLGATSVYAKVLAPTTPARPL